MTNTIFHVAPLGLLYGRKNSTGRELQRVTRNSAHLAAMERQQLPATNETKEFGQDQGVVSNVPSLLTSEAQKHKKALMQCLLLEMGILFHSVFIGMALSVAVGNDFIVLLIAITFHRK